MENEQKNIGIKIYGKLKNSGIRFSAMHQAYKLGLYGFARFTGDNSVFIEAEGSSDKIEQLKEWCQKTAMKYEKGKIEIESKEKMKGYTEFNIID